MTVISSAETQLHTGAGAGAVELREDAPLKAAGGGGGAGAGGACCAGGPRLILACFAALTAAITLALFTQIYYGDYEVVPHGGVASDAAACSAAGTGTLKGGGRAVDAAAAAALCLAVLAPHLTSLDASGSLLYWEYRRARTQAPLVAEWGGPGGAGGEGGRPPRLLAALAELHALHGALPWAAILQPAIDLAKNGFPVSEALSAALAAAPEAVGAMPLRPGAGGPGGPLRTAPALAAYLQSLQRNTSAELSAAWGPGVVRGPAAASAVGAWRLHAGGARAGSVRRVLAAALQPPPSDLDDAERRVLAALRGEAAGSAPAADGAVATGLAVVDSLDAYVAAVTGLSVAFGSGPATADGWTRDSPAAPLDLAPAILLDDKVCGTRYVLGGGSSAALAQTAAALAAGGGAAGVERPRAALLADGSLVPEAGLAAGALPAGARLAPGAGAGETRTASVNVVQQRADALLTHADSRGGGLASRF